VHWKLNNGCILLGFRDRAAQSKRRYNIQFEAFSLSILGSPE
jgi:hypothetical protein